MVKSISGRDENGDIIEFEGDFFLSTMPVKDLLNGFNIEVPKEILEVGNGLIYRDFITVGLLLEKLLVGNISDNWIYIQEPEVKVGRLQIFNNWSPYLVNDPSKIWVGMEYFCNENDALYNLSESEMKDFAIKELEQIKIIDSKDVLDGVVIKMPKTYPAYFGTYNEFDRIINYVNQFENLFLIGRNGMHKYNNQDHSMLTAIKAVENISKGITSKDNIWQINTEQDYHESK
jgi:protoporphyrinogen oxidase